jgi:hypothetical protein
MISGDRWKPTALGEIRVEFGPEDAVAAAERLIRPAGGGLPMVAEAAPAASPDDPVWTTEPHAPQPRRNRVLAVVLLLVFLLPFLATAARTIAR